MADEIKRLTKESSLGDVLNICNTLASRLESDKNDFNDKLGKKLGINDTAVNASKLGGKEASEYIRKAELTLMTTAKIDNSSASTIKLAYSYSDPINKLISTEADIEIEFDTKDESFAVPTSVIFIEATNSAKIRFKNATLLSTMPPDLDETYSVVVYVSKIGDRWLINEIKPVLDEG